MAVEKENHFEGSAGAVGLFEGIERWPDDVAIPSRPFGFKTLKNAQALGDLETLRAHGLPAAKLRLDGDVDPAESTR
jgi:hypothetical protein